MEKGFYKIIKDFDCCGKHMIIVKIGNAAHVMDYSDWKLVYGRSHFNKWKKNGNRHRFKREKCD